MPASADWRDDLERWLEPFVARLHHPARAHMCPVYVAGLIGPGERKYYLANLPADTIAVGDTQGLVAEQGRRREQILRAGNAAQEAEMAGRVQLDIGHDCDDVLK